ncbi:hypothetical protein SZN_28078 [Streptomyces zinciresistens K42]|uniref:Uncharacterized protein n=1 Tax=Streptomyces zinciresistens K42 TaxID=700597 RepID=G2GJC3_9ACTN|nr:hypothetical protein [Streptomyces zinciresistens]EGX56388.1 hypothetical protein SZN_28078 [Streptomyces zinciresistens K42]
MTGRSPDGPGQGPGEGAEPPSSSISDEEWQTFLQDAERDVRSAPKEPSARARMVTERLRQQDARGEAPPGWRTGPAGQGTYAGAARRRRWWAVVAVPLAVAVAVVVVRPSLLPGDPFGSGSSAPAPPLPEETAAPSAPPPSADPSTPTLARPFAGSPAEGWADGAAGIAVPRAKAVGTLSAARVAQALRLTRTLLIDANLDPATLRGERPAQALGVLEPRQSELVDRLTTALRAPDEDHDPLSMFSRFDPGEVRPAGDVVKTRGRMTFTAGERASVVVRADYTFVYPLVRPGSDEVARTIVRRVLDVELSDPARYRVTPGRITVLRYDQEVGNTACDVYDGYLHPRFDSAPPTGAPPAGPTTDPYDRSKEIGTDRAQACGTVSRT